MAVTKKGTKKKDKLGGTGDNDKLVGLAGNDTLKGKGGDDKLIGGPGNDTLDGGKGRDVLKGGGGDDFLAPGNDLAADKVLGGGGFDTVDYRKAGGAVEVDLVTGVTGGRAANDVLSSIEAVAGSRFDDTIGVGYEVADTSGDFAFILSGAGGLGGNDTLEIIKSSVDVFGATFGGEGADRFILHTGAFGDRHADIDFNASHGDKLVISSAEFAGITSGVFDASYILNTDATIVGETAVLDADPTAAHAQFIYYRNVGFLLFDPDGTGLEAALVVTDLVGDLFGGYAYHSTDLLTSHFEIIA